MADTGLISMYLSAKTPQDKDSAAEILAMIPENRPGVASFTVPFKRTSRYSACRCPQCLMVPPHRRVRFTASSGSH